MDPITVAIVETTKTLGAVGLTLLVLVWRLRIADDQKARTDVAGAGERQQFLDALERHRETELKNSEIHRLGLQEILTASRTHRTMEEQEHARMERNLQRP